MQKIETVYSAGELQIAKRIKIGIPPEDLENIAKLLREGKQVVWKVGDGIELVFWKRFVPGMIREHMGLGKNGRSWEVSNDQNRERQGHNYDSLHMEGIWGDPISSEPDTRCEYDPDGSYLRQAFGVAN